MATSEKEPLLSSVSKSGKALEREESSFWSGKDRALGWTVATAIMLINFITIGLGRMSGILYVDFMRNYRVNRQLASAPFSIQQSTRNLFGPLVGLLGHRFGIRKVTIVGGLIGAFSAAACAFAKDIIWITVFWGGLYGIGIAFTSTLSQVILDDYFDRDLSSASGLSFSGGSVGAMVFSFTLQQTIDDYGLENSYFIMGAVILLVVPLSITLTSPPWPKIAATGKPNDSATASNIPTKSQTDLSAEDDDVVLIDSTNPNERIVNNRHPNTHKEGDNESSSEHSLNRTIKNDKTFESEAKPLTEKVDKFKKQDYLSESCQVSINVNNDCLLASYQNINFQFLHENINYVVQMLNLQLSSHERDKSSEANSENSPTSKKDFFRELEILYSSAKQLGCNLSLNNSSERENENKFSDSDKHQKAKDECDTSQNAGNSSHFKTMEDSKTYILSHLRGVFQNREYILPQFDDQSREHAGKVLEEIRKLHEFVEAYNISTQKIGELPQITSPTNSRFIRCCPFLLHIQIVLKLYLNPAFLIICLCRAVHLLTFMGVLTVIVDFSMDRGLKESDGKYAVASMSLGDLIGRLCTGWITDFRFITLEKFMLITMFFIGVLSISLPLLPKSLILLVICVYSILQGSVFIRHPVLVSKYTRINERTVGMGFMTLFSGLLGFVLPVYIGHFRDYIGSYNQVFYINGGICIGIGFLWILENWLKQFVR